MSEAEALIKQARKALKNEDVLEAIDLFEEALELDPDEADAHEGLASACTMAQEYRGAIEHFKRVTQLKPRDARAYVNLGAIYNMQENYKDAAEFLRKGIQRDSKNADAYYNLGIAQKNLNQLSMAVSAYREAVRLNPEMIDAHVNLANVYLDQKNNRKAIEHYNAALAVDPKHDKAKRGLDHANGVVQKKKLDENPFGRLVDTDKLVEKGAETKVGRALSEDERFEDRQFVQLHAAESGNLAEHLWKHLRDRVEPALLEFNRIIAQDADQRHGLFETQEKLHTSVKFANEMFENWQKQFQSLKAHEAEMKPE